MVTTAVPRLLVLAVGCQSKIIQGTVVHRPRADVAPPPPPREPQPDLRSAPSVCPRRPPAATVLVARTDSASWYVSRAFEISPADSNLTLPCPFNLTCSSAATTTAHPSKQQCRGCSLGPLHVKHKRCEVRPFFRYSHVLLSFVSPRAVCKFSNGIFTDAD